MRIQFGVGIHAQPAPVKGDSVELAPAQPADAPRLLAGEDEAHALIVDDHDAEVNHDGG